MLYCWMIGGLKFAGKMVGVKLVVGEYGGKKGRDGNAGNAASMVGKNASRMSPKGGDASNWKNGCPVVRV